MMKTLFVSFAFVSVSAFATTVPSKAALRDDMKSIATNYQKLGKQIDQKSKNESSRDLTQKMIQTSIEAQAKTPPAAEKLEGPAKDEVLKKYQSQMQLMLDRLTNIKEALKKNDNEEARRHYESLKPMAAPGHGAQFE